MLSMGLAAGVSRKSSAQPSAEIIQKHIENWPTCCASEANWPASAPRELARSAGVHIFHDGNDVLYAIRSVLVLHARQAGSKTT